MTVFVKRLFCLFCLTTLPLAYAIAQDGDTQSLLRQASRAMRRQHVAEAAALYQKVLQLQADNTEANFGYGSALLQQKKELEAARTALQKAYDLNPQYNPQLAYRLGRAYHLVGRYTEAIPFYEASIKTLRNTPSMDDLMEEDGPELRVLDINYRFSASALLLQSRKEMTECESALALQGRASLPADVTALGASVNTPMSEYAPVANDNGRMLLFASRRAKAGQEVKTGQALPHENIFYALRDQDGQWQAPKEMGRLNTRLHEAPLTFSPDGRNLYLYRDINGGDIFIAKRTGEGTWSDPTPLAKPINTPFYEPSFCLSPDGRVAIFSSDRPDGFGGLDLWISALQPDNTWSPAFNLGASINSPYDEDSPCISFDGKFLYFSSKGHNSIGGFDLFRSQVEGPLWSEPVNLGVNVNSPFDDLYLTLTDNDQEGFFASDRPGAGAKDLFAVRFGKQLPTDSIMREAEPVAAILNVPTTPTTLTVVRGDAGPNAGVSFALSGKVSDSYSHQALPVEIVIVNRTTRESIVTSRADSATGRFRIMLPSDGTPYALEIQYPDYMFYTRNVDVAKKLSAEVALPDIALAKLEKGATVVLNNLYFDYGKATIAARSQPELKRLHQLLKANPHLKIEIGGHTDNKGTADFNQKLSELRAQSVVRYMLQRGVTSDRLKAIGYGFRQPVAPNTTEAGRQRNRRTELKVLEN